MELGALLGFGGVIITLVVNGWLQRVQHERDVEHERAGIRGTLFAELTTILKFVDRIGDSYVRHLESDSERLDIFFPRSFELGPIDTIRPQFGKLTARQALAAINAINIIRAAPGVIEGLVQERPSIAVQIEGEGPIQIPTQRLATVAQHLRLLRDTVVRELETLDQDNLFNLVDLAADWLFDLETYLNDHKIEKI